MKGIVFTEFLEMVEARFSPEICERLLETSDVPSHGVYTFARLGGEEFCALLPETSKDGALTVAERLRALVSAQSFEAEGATFPVTVSIGVCACDGGAQSLDAMMAQSDEALYEAKRNGRNRVAVARPGS
jgi:diguanylate cyclase (GGDEF)-like protein